MMIVLSDEGGFSIAVHLCWSLHLCGLSCWYYIQSNLNSSNTDGSFIIANSKVVLSPYEILPIAPESKYLRKFSYFILYDVCTY